MSTKNGVSYQDPKNINLKGSGKSKGSGVIRWDLVNSGSWSSSPIDSSNAGLWINSSGQLVFSYQGANTVIGAGGGGGGTPSWETIFASDSTFTITPDQTFTIAGNRSTATAVVTLSNIGGGSGAVLAFSNSGSGMDVLGTSSTWQVTKAGVATFAGLSISGTTTAIATTGAAVWTLLDNSATALSIDASGATGQLLFDTTNGAEVISTSATIFSILAGQMKVATASNSVSSVLVTNNTATTFGANANSSGVVVIRSTSLTTGALLQLQVTEGTLAGGFFIVGRHVTAGSNVYTVGENGVTTIAGLGGSDMLTVTAGDVNIGDGSITMVDADNAATLSITNNTATSATVFVYAGSGVFTGTTTTSFMTLTASGLTSGTVLYMPVAGLTSGTGLHIVAATANFTTSGTLIKLDGTAATAGNYLVAVTTGAYTGTGMITATAGAMTTGILLALTSTTGLTSGSLIRATTSTAGAIATNGAYSFLGTGAFTSGASTLGMFHVAAASTVSGTIMSILGGAQTTGIALNITDPSTGMTSGSLLRVITATTGAVATNGIVSFQSSGAFTSTTIGFVNVIVSGATAGTGMALQMSATSQTSAIGFRIDQSNTTTGFTGSMFQITGTSTTGAGNMINVVAVNTTAGDAMLITNNALTLGAGTLINLVHGTSVIGAGSSMLRITSTGVDTGTTTGTMLDLAATAATTAHLAIITSATLTTGIGIKMTLNGLTSGSGMSIISSSADTTARGLVQLTSSSTSATGASAIRFTMALLSTHFRKFATDSLTGVTLWYGDGTTANGALSGTAGDICLNAGSNKPEYCTGTTNWSALV